MDVTTTAIRSARIRRASATLNIILNRSGYVSVWYCMEYTPGRCFIQIELALNADPVIGIFDDPDNLFPALDCWTAPSLILISHS